MLDLEDLIPGFGTAASRGMEAVKVLRNRREQCGHFDQNGVDIVVYQDSTERELMWQYEAKRQRR